VEPEDNEMMDVEITNEEDELVERVIEQE